MESVRMGEMKVSGAAGDELVAIGLGSCIGLALIDRAAGVGALAHIVLPESGPAAEPVGKFANLAVPELIARTVAAGGRRTMLQAVLVGGAKMFAIGGSLDIGARNDAAVREALKLNGVRISASETGGDKGRTARVIVGSEVSVQEAGGERVTLLHFGSRLRAAA
jgi:chemotaxis protein CheD